MVIHHSLAFPTWYVLGDFYPYLLPYTHVINYFGGFAVVPLFLFLTGWTYYFHADKSYKYSFRKIVTFLLDYWLVLFFFAFLAFRYCGYNITAGGMVKEMFTATNEIMIFAWFVFLYLEVMLFLPFFHKHIAEPNTLKKTIYLTIAVFAVVKFIAVALKMNGMKDTFIYTAVNRDFFRYALVPIVGYLCARGDAIGSICRYIENWGTCKKCTVLAGLILLYNFIQAIGGVNIGFIFVPIYIAVIMALKERYDNPFDRLVIFLGKHSMNIWFLSCLFWAEATRMVFQKFAYVGNPILDVMWILFVCTCVSVPLTKIQQLISKGVSKVFD